MSPNNPNHQESPTKATGMSAQMRNTVSPELVLQEYFEVLSRRKWSIAAVFLIVLAIGTLFTLTRRRQYEASTKLVILTRQGAEGVAMEGAQSGIADQLGLFKNPRNVQTQVEVVNSPDLLNAAFDKLSQDDKNKGFRTNELPVWATAIENKPETDVIQINVTSFDPAISAKLANLIANTYLDRDLQSNVSATQKAEKFVQSSLADIEGELGDAQTAVQNFKIRTKFMSPDETLLATQRMFTLRQAVDDARTLLTGSENRAEELGKQAKAQDPMVDASKTIEQNPVYALVAARISDLESQRVDKMQDFATNSLDVKKLDDSIAEEKNRLASTAEKIISQSVKGENPIRDQMLTSYAEELANKSALQTQYDVSKTLYDSMLPELAQYPTKEKGLEALQQKLDALVETYTMLSERLYNLRIQENSNLANGMIASEAHPPLMASYPKVVLSTLMVVILAIVTSIFAAVLLERFDSRIHDPMRLDQLTGLTTMTAVPEIDVTNTAERPLIGAGHDSQAFLESYRILRNNIAFSSPDRECRTIAVTSAGQGEGKSTTAINLAISMGMDGKRALIADVDLRRPSVHTALGLPRDFGFTSVVTGKKTLEEAVQKTAFENVECLAAGPLPPNPTEFLNSMQSREVLFRAAELYDVVIMDCPPTTGLSDVQVISTFVDGMLLVVGLEITRFPQLRATMQTLWQANAPMLGVVINRIAPNRPGYGYYYSYYTYYGSDEPGNGKSATRRRKKKKGAY